LEDFNPDNISLLTCRSRIDLWIQFINLTGASDIGEIGVFRGIFASQILKNCVLINKYYMIDPWRKLEDWNKPLNIDNQTFEQCYLESLERTAFAKNKRIVLRGKTTEVINHIEDKSLDLIYIDGDHTLKGISIDLLNSYSKVRDGGWIAGDDFCSSIWQHKSNFEPTLIFPYAIYFAEAIGARIYALPFNQFLIKKDIKNKDFRFLNLSGDPRYNNISLLKQIEIKLKNE
tara:strand:+ start:5891 stop:6583 length:693 start_codon:yes stop_codon:yes gene_type:complete